MSDRTTGPLKIGVTLSGGLDSGLVAAFGAGLVRRRGETLAALTHIPRFPSKLDAPGGDERASAGSTAAALGLPTPVFLDSPLLSPLQAIELSLAVHKAPLHAAGNQFWMHDIMATAKRDSIGVMLVGQAGNATVSWNGAGFMRTPADYGSPSVWKSMLSRRLSWLRNPDVARTNVPWDGQSAITKNFASRIGLESVWHDVRTPVVPLGRPSWEPRLQLIRSLDGTLAEKAAHYGIVVRDPTADVKVAEFCLGIPDAQHVSLRYGRRWLARRAGAGTLPLAVLAARRRSRQAADLVERLKVGAPSVETLLTRLSSSEAVRHYVDIDLIRRSWSRCQTDRRSAYAQAHTVVTRGIFAGLFVEANS